MHDRRKLWAQVGAVAAPLLVFAGARVLLAPIPQSSGAAITPVSVPAVMPAPAAAPLNDVQQRAVEWSRTLAWDSLTSPLCRTFEDSREPEPVDTPLVAGPDPEPDTPELPPVDPVEGLRLTAVLGDSDGGMAMINGKLYRAGDEPKPGLRVISVDARNNRVILAGRAGARFILGREPE